MSAPGQVGNRGWGRLIRSIVVLLAAVCLARFAIRTWGFILHDLQMDLAGRTFAARAARDGLSPYVNNLAAGLRYWDGGTHVFSSFIQPPSVALLFLPFASLPYFVAKLVWTLGACLALVLALALAGRLARVRLDRTRALGLLIVAASYYPLLLHVERGQVETFILLAVVACAIAVDRFPFLAGLLLGPAIALKLHCCLLLPFLVLRGRTLAALGALAAFAGLELASIVLLGPDLGRLYWTHELPRIVQIDDRHAPAGPELPAQMLERRPAAPLGSDVVDGRPYVESSIRFAHNATVVRPVRTVVERTFRTGPIAASPIALALFACLFLIVAARHWRSRDVPLSPSSELAYWLLALVSVMLSAPLTWVMSLVWLLPVPLLALSDEVRWMAAGHRAAAAGACLAFLWIGSPEIVGPDIGPAFYHQVKYPIGLLLLFPFLLVTSAPMHAGNRRVLSQTLKVEA